MSPMTSKNQIFGNNSTGNELEALLVKENEIEKELKILKAVNQSDELELMHKYNDIKDATQILLGAIGNIEGVTVRELHKRFQLPTNE